MFDQYISGSIAISINQPTRSSSVQSALDSFPAEFIGLRVIGIPNRNSIVVQSASLAGIRFFLCSNFNPVALAEAFQLAFQRKYWNLSKVLIVAFAHIDRLLQVRVVAHNNFANLVGSAPIDNVPSGFVQVVIDLVTPLVQQTRLAISQAFNALPILNRLQKCIALVVPLVNRLEVSSINDERATCSADAGSQVVQAQVNAQCVTSWLNLLDWFSLVDIGHIKVSRPSPTQRSLAGVPRRIKMDFSASYAPIIMRVSTK
jgi:hypothetical protein